MFQNAWQNFDWRIAVILFLAYALVDAIFVLYTLAVTKRQALKAANFSFIYYFVVAIGVFEYVHNFLYIVAIACGSWLGTFMIVLREKRQTE